MRKQLIAVMMVCVLSMTACAKSSENTILPLMGLAWFTGYEDVKTELDGYTLLNERENTKEKFPQKMQDYADVSLFDYNCDLTLCFTDSGLIGFNYHDVNRNQSYRDWFSTLETEYGQPTERGSGMASWYDNPVGKNTAIYLFNLEEGVQVSIYATADSPDRSYEKPEDVYIPTPELRTPVVPAPDELTTAVPSSEEENVTTTVSNETITSGERHAEVISTDFAENMVIAVTDDVGNVVSDEAGSIVTTILPVETGKDGKPVTTVTKIRSTTTITTTLVVPSTETAVDSQKEEQTQAFLLNGLQFYGSPIDEQRKMSKYTQLYNYRTEEPGQPWELIMEYENVPYLGKNCDGVLCFTSLGLVGINYFDSNTSNYKYWTQQLTDIYGVPDEVQYDYTAWNSSPVGNDTMIYLFALEDGVQISFFADDTGSELS